MASQNLRTPGPTPLPPAVREALARQIDGVTDIDGLIKATRWGEIYQQLEEAADRAEDIADTLESIVVKNA